MWRFPCSCRSSFLNSLIAEWNQVRLYERHLLHHVMRADVSLWSTRAVIFLNPNPYWTWWTVTECWLITDLFSASSTLLWDRKLPRGSHRLPCAYFFMVQIHWWIVLLILSTGLLMGKIHSTTTSLYLQETSVPSSAFRFGVPTADMVCLE